MPHLRSHGPPPELALPSRSDSRDFSEGDKHAYLVLKYKETSSRLDENGPGNKKRRKLNSEICRATRQQ
ncbi:hypothetical protein E3N88_12037 [Mikania micrantha]|uniref:Uncharacterized protein n=1 Tax=Mikania micrantha TaxID=192012 RepID=A0A5N6P5Q4_9ASTR|nr:hypothetical protein E3N88_12037 [Mikania micrantha]